MEQNSNTGLFLSIVEKNKGIIYKIANTYCKAPEERKDLVQEIILQLWKSFHQYNDVYKYSTWIYRIALNVAISFYRKEKRKPSIVSAGSASILNIISTGENNFLKEETFFLQRFISELKELDKALILLFLEEKNYKEISEILGVSETNVSTKVNRIKKILKQKFSQVTM